MSPAHSVPRTTYLGWIQYRDIVEPYHPDRVVRQLGFVQGIPPPCFTPDYASRPAYETRSYAVSSASAPQFWDRFNVGTYCIPLSDYLPLLDEEPTCSDDYEGWFYTYSHPLLMSPDAVLGPPPRPDRTNVDFVSLLQYLISFI